MDPSQTRVVLRPIGSPLPLGMSGLAVGSFVQSGFDLHWVPSGEAHQVGLILLAVPFPLQLIGCVLAYLARDGTTGAALGVLAATWLGLALIHLISPPGDVSGALGLMLVSAGGVLALSAVTASRSKPLPAAVFLGASLRFLLAGVYELSATGLWQSCAGVLGLGLAAAAGYCVLAFELEGQRHRTVLPTLRRGAGRDAITADYGAQVAQVEREAGVRQTS